MKLSTEKSVCLFATGYSVFYTGKWILNVGSSVGVFLGGLF